MSTYEHRIGDVNSRMERAGFDLIISQDPTSMCWLSGHDGWSFHVPQCVSVHLDEAMPPWFGRTQDAKAALIAARRHRLRVANARATLSETSLSWSKS